MPIPSCKDLSPIIRHSGYTQADDIAKMNLAAFWSSVASATCGAYKHRELDGAYA